jgi:hypothetical protein
MNDNLGDKMISVREIFETMLGKEHSEEILNMVQEEYMRGKRGDNLVDAVTNRISSFYKNATYFECVQRSTIAILVGPSI